MPPWPGMFRHLKEDVPKLNVLICIRAAQDLAVCEEPPSSNRGPDIDAWNARAQAPKGSFWCASWATAVWEDCVVDLPPKGRASCDNLVRWAKQEGLWVKNDTVTRFPQVLPGSMVVYTNGDKLPGHPDELDAVHVGIVVRVTPYLMSMEGNASIGGAFSNNGEAVVLRRVDPRRVYGFISPRRTQKG
jgi:hypothetical protein